MFNEILFNENELVTLIAEGDEQAFSSLFKHYRNRIYSIAYKLTHSHSVAEEIVQEVFLKIWLRRKDLPEIQNFSAYLFIVTRNDALKVLKRIARNYKYNTLAEQDIVSTENNSSDNVIEKEYNLLLQHAIERLPNQQKRVYKLIKDEGLKREEVAHLLQLQPETVKFHMSQAMKNVRAFCIPHLDLYCVATFFLHLLIAGRV